jgi:hypothetical protein
MSANVYFKILLMPHQQIHQYFFYQDLVLVVRKQQLLCNFHQNSPLSNFSVQFIQTQSEHNYYKFHRILKLQYASRI